MDSTACMVALNWGTGLPELAVSSVLLLLITIAPAILMGFLLNFLLSLPMRRRERTRFFLDLLETALARGQAPEHALSAMAATGDRTPGKQFNLLAGYLGEGLPLHRALELVPRLVPHNIGAMLLAGMRLGNLQRMLPACRRVLQEGPSDVQSATNYAMVILLAFSPVAVCLTLGTYIFVMPKFEAILVDMGAGSHGAFQFLRQHPAWVITPQVLVFVALMAAAAFYVGGQRMIQWTRIPGFPWADRIAWLVPWKRYRLQRTFSVMLASLLDGGVPESEAVKLAAEGTGNAVAKQLAVGVVDALAAGKPLREAIAALDPQGEFRWRLTNGGHGGFTTALRGWHDALETRAFRVEQTAAHLATTGLVLMNGMLVILVALATIGSLIRLIDEAVLW